MTLSKYFYTLIFISLTVGGFLNGTSILLLLPIPVYIISHYALKQSSLLLFIGIMICLGFSSYYKNSEIEEIKNKLETESNTLIGHFKINQGKIIFQTKYLLDDSTWSQSNISCTIINPPEQFSPDSSYIIKTKFIPSELTISILNKWYFQTIQKKNYSEFTF